MQFGQIVVQYTGNYCCELPNKMLSRSR